MTPVSTAFNVAQKHTKLSIVDIVFYLLTIEVILVAIFRHYLYHINIHCIVIADIQNQICANKGSHVSNSTKLNLICSQNLHNYVKNAKG